MAKQEISLYSDLIVNNDDIDSIKTAITKLSTSSEKQLDQIKNEKWFTRVFDMLTFSQKKDIRLAEQISTVAQAQTILIELLLRLSENDKCISSQLFDQTENIKKLANQDIYLLSRIKKIENSLYGLNKITGIDSLTENEKNILWACIYYISEKHNESSDDQKRYNNALSMYLNTEGAYSDNNPFEVLEDINVDSKRTIFFICMVYFFLSDCSEASYEIYEDDIDEFDEGKKTIKQIKQQINAIYQARGVDGFITQYEKDNDEELTDSFYIEFDDIFEEDDEFEDNDISSDTLILPVDIDYSANEDETISTMLSIEKGNKVVFKNKNIHLKAYIKCDGELEFDNCVIYYNEFEEGDEIRLGEDASITFDGCMINCKGYDESIFITNADYCKNKVSFINTSFLDCGYFVKLNNVSSAIISKCYFHNCFKGFMNITIQKDAEFVMDSNYIKFDGVSAFNSDNSRYLMGTIIDIDTSSMDEPEDLFITNMLIEESIDEQSKVKDASITLLNANKMILKQSTVLGLSKDIFIRGAYDCYMKDCLNGFRGYSLFEKTPSEIKNCLFDNCTNVVNFQSDVLIKDSRFVSCYGEIIKSLFSPFNLIKCSFYNTKFSNKSILPSRNCGCIEVISPGSSIKECVFDGIELFRGHLITGAGVDSSSRDACVVSGCYFLNWKKEEDDKIINEYSKYYGLFNKLKTVKSINISSDCKGLDKSSGTGVSDKSQDEIYDMGQQIIGSNVNHEGDYSFVNRVKNETLHILDSNTRDENTEILNESLENSQYEVNEEDKSEILKLYSISSSLEEFKENLIKNGYDEKFVKEQLSAIHCNEDNSDIIDILDTFFTMTKFDLSESEKSEIVEVFCDMGDKYECRNWLLSNDYDEKFVEDLMEYFIALYY